ncbi:MAG: DUF262 domain-containing protein [Prevotellaceae bacterium]|jgi:hypothetical protein|nr:DUF262 domain-containing protein [Prevotellaceae bacterium]
MEFSTKNNRTVSLSLLKKETVEGGDILFDLIDENRKTWIELKLHNNELSTIQKSEELVTDDIFDFKLEEVLSQIVETEKSGTDSYSERNTLELNPYDPDQIKVRSDKISITLISQMIDNGDIDLNPDFQRHLVWDQIQKSRLIESVLLRIPLPMFYFAEDKEGKLSVVDGLQRISTIKDFMDNKFPLKNLQYLEESCGGKYYATKGSKQGIDTKYFRWFNLTTLSANIIDPSSPFKVKYDIFRRINTGGKPLNNQEIRNCLTGQGLRDVLKKMTALNEFKTATDCSIKSKRMEDQEVALRFLMFYEMKTEKGNIASYSGYMDFSLDAFTEAHIKSRPADFEQAIKSFSNAMKNAEYLLGKKHAFRKIALKDIQPDAYKQLINKALFVCVSILLADYDHARIKKLNDKQSLLSPLANEVQHDKELFAYLSYGTNGKANLLYAYETLEKLFNSTIKY